MQDSNQVYWHLGYFNDECIAYDPLEAIKASRLNVNIKISFVLPKKVINYVLNITQYLWIGMELRTILKEEVDIFVYQRDQMFIPSEKWV